MLTLNRILCPTDFSPESAHATEYAMELARNSGAEILLLHVQTLVIPRYPSGDPGKFLQRHERDSIRHLEAEAEKLRKDYPRIRTKLVPGFIIDVILNEVNEEHIDIVVMSSHGRTGLKRLLMGSIAEIVLRDAPCPVMIIKSGHATEPAV